MDSLILFPLLSFAALAVGVTVAFFARRFPSHGWVAIILLLSAVLAWMRIDAGESSRPSSLPMSMLFWLTAPVAVVYSFRTRRHAPDRLPALAAFVGSFIIGGFFLFMLAGLTLWIYEIFTHAR
jgi:hypothetical protein